MRTILLTLLLFLPGITLATDFSDPVILYQTEEAIEFARNPQGTLGIDSLGRLHWVYFVADETGQPPDNQIWYQMYADERSSTPVRVDHGARGGGRHPFLAVDSNNTVYVTWQDYRHCTASGHYIDNVEIYANRKPINGAFSDLDTRISHTEAGHSGDNGYIPFLSTGLDNRVHVVWYDFSRNGSNADIYLRSGDADNNFADIVGIESFRITSLAATDDTTSYWFPCIVPFVNGGLYVVWGLQKGYQGTFQLQGKSSRDDDSWNAEEWIADQGGNFYDPPRLASSRNGDLGLVYTRRVNGQSVIFFQYRPVERSWNDAIQVNHDDFDASQPDLVFDSQGNVRIVWQEDYGDRDRIFFTVFDPLLNMFEDPMTLSEEDADARTPVIAQNPLTEQISILWMDRWEEDVRKVVLRQEKRTAVHDWFIQ